MDDPVSVAAALAVSFVVAAGGTGVLCRALARRGIVDTPNERSSHVTTTPRGGGIAVVAAILAGIGILYLSGQHLPDRVLVVAVITGALAAVSWIDDVRGLPAMTRLLSHVICVSLSLFLLPLQPPAFLDVLPVPVQYTLVALAWLWFINLFNFMDGIDGITGVQTLVTTLGVSAVLAYVDTMPDMILICLVVAAAIPGFLYWNWSPARIFLGDVGSVSLGYLLGWVLLSSAGNGLVVPALLIPGYYIADATFTLLRRALRGEKIWQAHREHAYQAAVQRGRTHTRVSIEVGVLGVLLVGCGLAAITHPWIAAGAGVVLTAAMMHHFFRAAR